ncbi:MAG: DNA-directed RNA polymerase subunit alpha [Spirochaetaceae bacterium]|jgi:DNA-directed RNA polymerase subunit alpha|nr:DNA-directed RNA polymerase subunit alpha [Spirochaetaceae bacterium]GMO17687.1 MAG: DNA-directed RNA polymerase subunit alpha [Termitinemataceae bacterium]
MARKNLMKGWKRPKGVSSFEHDIKEPNYGKFSAAPFESGFGTTVGNTLRRVLLSSIQGYAITSVKITSRSGDTLKMISSEFEPIPNIVEDTLEVLGKLKQIRLKLPEDCEQEVVSYEFSGKRIVKSEDFAQGSVEICNPGLHIMTLADDANIEMEVQFDMGRGYVPSEVNAQYIEVIGTIPMDAIFSPVTKVKYSVEPTRVGQRSDYDKLIIEVWTDGTVRPEDAVAEAAKIAKEHFSVFINFDEDDFIYDDDNEEDNERIRALLNTKVEELELSVRSSNCLKIANISTIGELVRRSEDDINKTRNFGKKSLQEIKERLAEWNLQLGITNVSELRNAIRLGTGKKGSEDEA